MKSYRSIIFFFSCIVFYLLLDEYFAFIGNAIHYFLNTVASSSIITKLIPYHNEIKISLVILALVPIFQTIRLIKTKSAEDVSVLYQFFAVISLFCINIDIFRSQFGKTDVNFFIIFCRYLKIVFYDLNIFLMYYFLGKRKKSDIFILSLFLLIQGIAILGFYLFPNITFKIVSIDIFGPIIATVFTIGVLKPLLQIFKTWQKKTANSVSLLYHLVFVLFLILSLFDNFIVFQTKGIILPGRTTMSNSIKVVLYLITFALIWYIRHIYKKPENKTK